MADRWYEAAEGLTVADRLRRPLVSHAPAGVIADDDLARHLVDDRSDALVRITELERLLLTALALHGGTAFTYSEIEWRTAARKILNLEK